MNEQVSELDSLKKAVKQLQVELQSQKELNSKFMSAIQALYRGDELTKRATIDTLPHTHIMMP